MVGEVDILVESARDRAADRKADCSLRNRSVFARQCPVGEKDAAGVVADRAAIEQLPRLAIRINGPTTEDARITEIEAFFTRPFDLAVGLADQYRLALVDRDLLWADLYLVRQTSLRAARWRTALNPPDRYPVGWRCHLAAAQDRARQHSASGRQACA
jgi:hypothetical protein